MPQIYNRQSTISNHIVHAVVPMKDLARAKSRLAELLTPSERRALALDMLQRVITTLLNCRLPTYDQSTIDNLQSTIQEVWVVSTDPAVLDYAATMGARALPDPTGDLNAALEFARGVVTAAGADGLLVVPADVPRLTAADLAGLVGALDQGAAVVVAPDREESGTNALGLRLPSSFPFQFGLDSFSRHLEATRARGLPTQVYTSPTLALDVDTAEEYERYHDYLRHST